jgi:hypothetical protein
MIGSTGALVAMNWPTAIVVITAIFAVMVIATTWISVRGKQ